MTVPTWLQSYASEGAFDVLSALVVLALGLGLAQLAGVLVARAAGPRLSAQHAMIVRRLVVWTVRGLTVAAALRELGFDLSVLLGAAGVLTVAVGFASQTSASNLISGLFLLAERPFVVGDIIKLGDLSGEVVSVDLLSVKVRTFDNLLVRIPNESLLKSNITNLTHFPIRRYDLPVQVAYGTDLSLVRRVLTEAADQHPLILDEPRPLVLFLSFDDSGMSIQFSVWAAKENFLAVRLAVPELVQRAFATHGITIPFPQRVVHRAPDAVNAP